jgi:hypothetical protein
MLSHDAESNKVRTPKIIINTCSTHFVQNFWQVLTKVFNSHSASNPPTTIKESQNR